MIELENLSDKSAEEIFNEAKRKISIINPEWTYQQESDPGITLLELFSWLKFDQEKYLNSISNKLKIKLLNLLGIKLQKRCGSKTLLQIRNAKENFSIPKNTKWTSDSLIFENESPEFITKSDVISLKLNNPEFTSEKKYYDLKEIERISIFGNNNLKSGEIREFIIVLSDAIPKNRNLNIYFDIFSEYKRNEIRDSFIPFAKIEWQYWGNSGKEDEWIDAKFSDKTNSFLNSGIVSIEINNKMSDLDGFYLLKCKLVESDYDFMPEITNIKINIFEVVQKDTRCDFSILKNSDITFDGENIKFKLNNNLCLYGDSMLYVNNKERWFEIDKFKLYRDIESGIATFEFEKGEIELTENQNDDAFLVVSFSRDIKEKIIVGSGTGFSNLIFNINFDDFTVYDDFKIMVGEKIKKKLGFKLWNRVDDFFKSYEFDDHFVYEENMKILAFGDNHHGSVPMKEKNNIRFCKLSFTQGEDSNLRENMIKNVITDNAIMKNSNIIQFLPATGGKGEESLEDAENRVHKIFDEKKRAVILEDYEEIIKKTPGLIIKNISVSASNDKLSNKVYVAVQTPKLNYITDSYKNNILKWIENFRLVNTDVEVMGPEIIFLDIKAKLILSSEHIAEKNFIENEFKNFIDNLNQKMGQNLIYGDLFKTIEKLKYVKYVENLEINSSIQDFKDYSPYDNIVASMNSIYEIRRLDIISLIDTEL